MNPDTVLHLGAAALFLAIVLVGVLLSETRVEPITWGTPRSADEQEAAYADVQAHLDQAGRIS